MTNRTKGSTAALAAPDMVGKVGVIENIVDYALAPASASEVAQVLNIPANTFVLRAGWEVLTPEGGTAAGTLGDGADPDGYHATVNANAAAGTTVVSAGATVGYALGKHYTTADTIDHVITDALDAAKVRYFAIVVDVSGR